MAHSQLSLPRRSDTAGNVGAALIGLGIVGLVCIFAFVGAPYIRGFLGMPSNEDVHAICLSQMAKESEKAAKDPFGKALFAGVSTGICGALKEKCDREPNGTDCAQIKRAITQMMR